MAYPIEALSVVEVRLVSMLNSQLCMNTFHYTNDEGTEDGVGALNQFFTSFNNVWAERITDMQTDDVTLVRADMQWVWPTRYRTVSKPAVPAVGQKDATTLPSGVAVVIRRFGEVASRKSQGRIYIYGLPTNDALNSQVTSAWYDEYAAGLEVATSAVLNTDDFGIYTPILWSPDRPTEKVKIVGGQVDRIIRYQRRREIGVGQ